MNILIYFQDSKYKRDIFSSCQYLSKDEQQALYLIIMETIGSQKYELIQTNQIHVLKVELKHQQDQTVITKYLQFDTFDEMVENDHLLNSSNIINISNALNNQEVYPQEYLTMNGTTHKMSVFPQFISDSEDQQQHNQSRPILKKKHIQKAKRRQKQDAMKARIAQLQKKLADQKKEFQRMQKELRETAKQMKRYQQEIPQLHYQLYQRQTIGKDALIMELRREIRHEKALNNALDRTVDRLRQERKMNGIVQNSNSNSNRMIFPS